MQRIYKTCPPKGLILWFNNRNPKPSIWDHLNSSDKKILEKGDFDYSKRKLRNYLFKEQNSQCCYCNKLILDDHTSKIEHYKPKDIYKNETFNYYNLILSCDGNSKRKSDKKYHCDKFKENNEIELNPMKQNHLNDFVYDEYGNIFSKNNICINAINVLGLDCKTLINRRKNIIEGVVYDEHGNYYCSKHYRNLFIRSIFKPLEFKNQIHFVLLNLVNRKDKTICLGALWCSKTYIKVMQVVMIMANFKFYKYKMK